MYILKKIFEKRMVNIGPIGVFFGGEGVITFKNFQL